VKTFFDSVVGLENLAAIAAAVAINWLSSRWHFMTGPQELTTIGRVQVTALVCSIFALIMGFFSFSAFRSLKRRGYADLGTRKVWLYVSVMVSAILVFLSILPTKVG
jgi:hypothetical protein